MIVKMNYQWNRFSQSWAVDVSDEDGNALVTSVPIVTGCDLLAQFGYLGFSGQLIAQTDGDPQAVPTFANLGTQGHVYFVVNPAAS